MRGLSVFFCLVMSSLISVITFSYLLLLNLNPRGHYISACSVYAAVQAQNKIKYKIHKTNKQTKNKPPL